MATKEEDLISGEKKLFPGREINVFEKNKIIIVGGGRRSRTRLPPKYPKTYSYPGEVLCDPKVGESLCL